MCCVWHQHCVEPHDSNTLPPAPLTHLSKTIPAPQCNFRVWNWYCYLLQSALESNKGLSRASPLADTTISLQPPSTDGATTTCGKSLDDDGDLILHRRRVSDMAASTVDRTPDRVKGGIVIHHRMATPLQDVGLQVCYS